MSDSVTPAITIIPDFSQVAPQIKPAKSKEMLTVDERNGKTLVRINSSSLSIILSCPKKAYYALSRQLKSKTESPALTFGTAIHKALEVFYSHPYASRTIPENFEEISSLMAYRSGPELDESLAESAHFLYQAIAEFVKAAEPLKMLPDSDKRSIPNGVWILQNYFKTYINDPYEALVDKDGPFTERKFDLVIYEDAELIIELFGTIDLALKNLHNGHVLPADHKTTSQVGSDFFNRIRPNHQYTAYLLGAREVFGFDTYEFLVNGIEVKKRPIKGANPSFPRQPTMRSETDFAEFKQSVIWSVKSFLQWTKDGTWPIGTVDACAMWGGCTFLEVCSSPPNIRENVISAKFNSEAE